MHPEFAALLEIARQHAAAGRFADMTALCRQLTQAPVTGTGLLIEVGNLFAAQGFLMQARHCYLRARQIEPENLKILGNLANLAQSAGQHSSARRPHPPGRCPAGRLGTPERLRISGPPWALRCCWVPGVCISPCPRLHPPAQGCWKPPGRGMAIFCQKKP